MKKFLKVFIVVILVLGVIAGTAFFFFRNLKEKNNNTGSLVAMLESDEKKKFDSDLQATSAIMKSSKSDLRLELIIETNTNLNQILNTLLMYYIETETNINNKTISNKLKELKSSRNNLSTMMAEYNVKKESGEFDRNTGANDLYEQSCVYLIKYAVFVNEINNNVSIHNKNADLKFSMFEIYSNIVITTFQETKVSSDLIVVKSADNINKINENFKIQNSFVYMVNPFSINCNLFIQNYNACDKLKFAKEFNNNIQNASKTGPKEVVAAFYLKQIYGI